jgi:hypothetical protein
MNPGERFNPSFPEERLPPFTVERMSRWNHRSVADFGLMTSDRGVTLPRLCVLFAHFVSTTDMNGDPSEYDEQNPNVGDSTVEAT